MKDPKAVAEAAQILLKANNLDCPCQGAEIPCPGQITRAQQAYHLATETRAVIPGLIDAGAAVGWLLAGQILLSSDGQLSPLSTYSICIHSIPSPSLKSSSKVDPKTVKELGAATERLAKE